MKPLIKIMLALVLFFTAILIVLKVTGLLSVAKIQYWLEWAHGVSPVHVAAIVIGLLFADLFMAVPSLTIMILAGYFLGHWQGAGAAITGMMLAGLTGYFLARYKGEPVVAFLLKKPQEREEAKEAFLKYGVIIILLSRAAPALPEVSACMAGLTRMTFPKFLAAWTLNAVPYALIATYAGSVSSLNNPMPAIMTVILLSGLFGTGWMIFSKKQLKTLKNKVPRR